ncbi:MAG: aminotransferase class V-fold PLP-dependent enzyme [Thermomicrobiales bacterium]|nr:aminotransferase class V-fold PLP-dependent enzyme [Thermomicrobiales bacterium]
MGIYESLGVRRVINSDARLTRLGGSKMPDVVLDAMREAADRYVDMHELQTAVGQRLAKLTNNDAAYATTGAAAGIVLATLASLNGGDLRQIARGLEGHLPERRRVLIQRAHRIPYDVVVRLAGAEIVEIGNALQTFDWELEGALNDSVAMVLWVAGAHLQRGALPLRETVAIARRHGVPVVVDAAAQLPPVESLWHFTRDQGADAAIFSGGKELRGPQASGMVVGKAEFLAAIAANGSPNQRLGRPMKVGKEEMIGLLAAVERYLQLDHAAALATLEAGVGRWVERFANRPGVMVEREFPDEAGQPTPRIRIAFNKRITGLTGPEAQRRLWEDDPRVQVALGGPDAISLSLSTLDGDDEEIVANRIAELLPRG